MDRKLATRQGGGLQDKALTAARLLVQRNLEPGWFINHTVYAAPLAPEGAQPIVLAMLRHHARVSEWTLSQVIHWALQGMPEAHQVLGEIAAAHVERGEPVPDMLKGYVVEQFHRHIDRRPGRAAGRFIPQDVCIAMLVLLLTEILPLRATRSGRSSVKPSACSVMATALSEAGVHRGGEAAVQKIWMNWRDLVMGERHATFVEAALALPCAPAGAA